MGLLDIPHVVHAFRDVERQQPDGSGEQIVVVETDLQLELHHPEHDKASVDALVQALRDHVLRNPHDSGILRLRTAQWVTEPYGRRT